MVSDLELILRLREFLQSSDLNTTTTATVRRRLEADFGLDLTDKKAFIREQVDVFLQSLHEKTEEAEEDAEAEDDEGGTDDRTENAKSEETDGSGSKDEDDEEEVQQTNNGKGKRRSIKHKNEVKKRGGGFSKLCSLSPQLQEFLGESEMARTEVVKQLWAYIRENNLQDPNNRRNINCDEPLHALFSVKSINMFQMNKALSKHIWPLDSDDVVPVKSMQKDRQPKQEREEDPDEPKRKEKRLKGGKSGFLAPLQLSDALVKFLGTGESALSRGDVIKRIWDYIKQNNLQDPSDKRRILCDEKLKELFDVDSFIGFTVSKLLASHFMKTEQ
ncbi:upstream activation factor subunit spp27-like [Juglans microcarpa x Juglans regia]|uniref:upstream activation factor subunit spp27-like n=1 Tax=Juglans microcarpa x Juglans regia TaxID=2249226 RepID=UPI001B7F442E|nr:upstream activation factor subunit spp27-like [Juglans microcarpa x Juglans regia]